MEILAEKLAQLSPGKLQYAVLSTSASEANDAAIETARNATGRKKIIALENSYHGVTAMGIAVSGGRLSNLFPNEVELSDWYQRVPFNDTLALDLMNLMYNTRKRMGINR